MHAIEIHHEALAWQVLSLSITQQLFVCLSFPSSTRVSQHFLFYSLFICLFVCGWVGTRMHARKHCHSIRQRTACGCQIVVPSTMSVQGSNSSCQARTFTLWTIFQQPRPPSHFLLKGRRVDFRFCGPCSPFEIPQFWCLSHEATVDSTQTNPCALQYCK